MVSIDKVVSCGEMVSFDEVVSFGEVAVGEIEMVIGDKQESMANRLAGVKGIKKESK